MRNKQQNFFSKDLLVFSIESPFFFVFLEKVYA